MANNNIIVHPVPINQRWQFEKTVHELLERGESGFKVTTLRIYNDIVEKKLVFANKDDEEKAMSEYNENPSFFLNEFGVITDGRDLEQVFLRPFADRRLDTSEWNRRATMLPIANAYIVRYSSFGSTPVCGIEERYTKSQIQVQFDADSASTLWNKDVPRTIYRTGEGKEESFWIADPVNPSLMYSLCDWKSMYKKDFMERFANEAILYNTPEFGGQTATAGQCKQLVVTMLATNLPGFDAAKVIDKLTYGAWNIALDGHVGSAKEVAQIATRMSASEAYAKEFGNIGTFAYFMGKMKTPEKSVIYDGNKIPNKKGGDPRGKKQQKKMRQKLQKWHCSKSNELADGLGFWAAEHAAQMFSDEIERLKFTASVVEGVAAQMRPHTCKLLASIVRRNVIKKIMSSFCKDVVVLERDKITPEDQANFSLCFSKAKDANGKKLCETSPFWNKIVVLCDNKDDEINFFTDLNGLKCTFDITRDSTCNVLALSSKHKTVEEGSKFSGQLLNSVYVVDANGGRRIVIDNGKSFLHDKADKIHFEKDAETEKFRLKKETIETRKVPSELFDTKSLDVGSIMQFTAPNMVNNVLSVEYRSNIDNTIKGMVRTVSELQFPTAGAYCKVVPDYGKLVADLSLLRVRRNGIIECYSTIINKSNIGRAIGVKYPKQGIEEFARFVPVSLDIIKDRLAEALKADKIDRETANELYLWFKRTSAGVIVIPAVEILKNLLAGMDFDGDAIVLFFDEKIVNTLWSVDTTAVIIDTAGMDSLLDLKEFDAEKRQKQ